MYMYMNHGTCMGQSNDDGHNENNSDKTHIRMDTQYDNSGVITPICPYWRTMQRQIMQTSHKVSMIVDTK